jgi:hypothetical protein
VKLGGLALLMLFVWILDHVPWFRWLCSEKLVSFPLSKGSDI